MHWRDVDRRLEPGVWDKLLISIPKDHKAGFAVSVCPPDRLRVSAGDEPIYWVRIEDGYYGYEFLRKEGASSWSIIPPIPFHVVDEIADGDPSSRTQRWSKQYASWRWASTRSPLSEGDWALGPHMRWHEHNVLTMREIEGIAAHKTRGYIDWDHLVHPLPLREMSPADSGRVKAWRKLARRGELPPVLLYWISGLVAYVVLDGHDRLLAAQLEQVPAPFLCLDRVTQLQQDAGRQALILDSVEKALDHASRTKIDEAHESRKFTAEKANRILLDAFTPLLAEQPSIAASNLVSPTLWQTEVLAEAARQGVDVTEMMASVS